MVVQHGAKRGSKAVPVSNYFSLRSTFRTSHFAFPVLIYIILNSHVSKSSDSTRNLENKIFHIDGVTHKDIVSYCIVNLYIASHGINHP